MFADFIDWQCFDFFFFFNDAINLQKCLHNNAKLIVSPEKKKWKKEEKAQSKRRKKRYFLSDKGRNYNSKANLILSNPGFSFNLPSEVLSKHFCCMYVGWELQLTISVICMWCGQGLKGGLRNFIIPTS